MYHFLLEYSRGHQRLQNVQRFTDSDDASRAYAAAESAARGNKDLEVVLVGADSMETIEQTHGQYFGHRLQYSRFLGPAIAPR